MITFKPVIRVTQVKKDGTVNIKIRVTHNRNVGYLPTEYYIKKEQFDNYNGKVIPVDKSEKAKKDADDINIDLLAQKGAYASKISKNKDLVQLYTLNMLLKFLTDETDPTDFISLLEKKIKDKTAIGNDAYAYSFADTKRVLEKEGYKTLPLAVITTQWIKALGQSLAEKGNSPNTIGHRMRNIRTVFNEAETGRFPFRGYKIPKAASTEHKDLSLEQMARIARLEIKDPLMRWSRDMYMLSFYLIGMNWKDLAFVKEIINGRIYYTRSKGKKLYSIKVFPEAQAIIDRYPGKKYLMDLMDHYSHYKTGTKRINIKLKLIAKECEINRQVSIYYARHSWSTIATEEVGISEDTVERCLGHALLKPINEITQIYIRKELKPCDDANEKVIKALMQNDDDDVITSLNL